MAIPDPGKPQRPRVLWHFAVAILFVSAAVFVYFAFISPTFYFFPDALYYDAVADALIKTGRLFDPSTLPSQPIYTPQNGIVFVDAAIRAVFPSARHTLIAILNGLAFAGCLTCIFKITRALDFDRPIAALAAAAFADSPLVLRVAAAPLNDVLFMALFFFGLLSLKQPRQLRLTIMAVLALIMGIFRLQGVVLFIGAALATWKNSRKEAAVYFAMAAVNIATPFAVQGLLSSDATRMHNIITENLSFRLFLNNIWFMLGEALPKLITAAGPAISHLAPILFPLCAALYLIIAYRVLQFVRNNNRFAGTVAAATFGTMIFVVITPYYDPRYYLCVFPFILLVPLMSPSVTRCLQILVLVTVCLLNLTGLIGRLTFAEVNFGTNARAAALLRMAAPSSPTQLISDDPHLSYFVYGVPARLSDQNISRSAPVVLFGEAAWRAAQVRSLEKNFIPKPETIPDVVVRFSPVAVHFGATVLVPRLPKSR